MVAPISGSRSPSIHMPTRKQLITVYRSLIEKAQKDGSLKPLTKAPRGANAQNAFDITPKGLAGSHQVVHQIGNKLYLKTQVVAPNAKPKWFGPIAAPLF